jgi:hypothetical protein
MRLTIFSPPSMVSARRSIAILSACYPPLGSRPREAGRSAATSSDLPFRWRRSIPLAIPAATFAVATRELRSTSTTAVERAAPSGERWQASAQSSAIICESSREIDRPDAGIAEEETLGRRPPDLVRV